MRLLMLAVLMLCLSQPIAGRAQDPGAAIRSVISDQIEAFRQDDFETAFSYASQNIKRMFGDPETFGAMVRNGYPMVWRPADVRFSNLSRARGTFVQNVLVTDGSGALHILEYEMVESENGWRINGVSMRRPGDAGA